MVPKGSYLNVSLLWPHAGTDALHQFYTSQDKALHQCFARDPDSRCGCSPRIVVRPAHAYYGERWVAVGDAAVARLYKDGINSAFLTARSAMQTAVERGVGAADFAAGYAPFCQEVATDNDYGRWLYNISAHLLRVRAITRGWAAVMEAETALQPSRRIQSRVMWGLLTGDESYRDLFRLLVRPTAMVRLGRAVTGVPMAKR
jgi:hypothetical protein